MTLDDRKSKLRLAYPLEGKKAQGVFDATTFLLDPIKNFVKTITFDNGKEFTLHEKIAQSLEIPILQSLIIHGKEDKMKMLTAYFVSIFQRNGVS